MCENTNINHGILIGSAIISQDTLYVPVLNSTNSEIHLYKNTCLCHIKPVKVEIVSCFNEINAKDKSELDKMDINRESLPKEQVILVINIIEEYAEIFVSENPGTTNLVEHTIDVGNNAPINQHPYRCSGAPRQIIEEQVLKMLEQKIIRPSRSPWSSPIVLVKKKMVQLDSAMIIEI